MFSCARCGEIAATIAIVTSASNTDDDGLVRPPLGAPTYRLDWLGVAFGPAPEALEALLSAKTVDSRDLTTIDWELGAFCCRRCEQNYCATCWQPWAVFDGDGSMWFEEFHGRCPDGHEQRLQD